MFFIASKKSQLVFLSSVLAFFFVFLFLLVKSDEPSASKDIPAQKKNEVIENEKNVEPGKHLFRIELTPEDTYVVVASKADELGASLDYFHKEKLTAVLSTDKKRSKEEITLQLKRKFLNSNVKEIDEITFQKEKSTEFIPVENTATFYSPDRKLFFSMPLTWTSEIKSDVYAFSDLSATTVLSVEEHTQEKSVEDFLAEHLKESATSGFVLDGDVEKIEKEDGSILHRWTLTNNDIFIPQGIIASSTRFYFFNTNESLSFDEFMLVFESAQTFE